MDREEAERCRGRILSFPPFANCDFMYDLPEHESGKVPSLQDPNRTSPLLPSCASANGREPAAARTMLNELYCVAHQTQQD